MITSENDVNVSKLDQENNKLSPDIQCDLVSIQNESSVSGKTHEPSCAIQQESPLNINIVPGHIKVLIGCNTYLQYWLFSTSHLSVKNFMSIQPSLLVSPGVSIRLSLFLSAAT